jgi:hypothetical protein
MPRDHQRGAAVTVAHVTVTVALAVVNVTLWRRLRTARRDRREWQQLAVEARCIARDAIEAVQSWETTSEAWQMRAQLWRHAATTGRTEAAAYYRTLHQIRALPEQEETT